MHKKMCHKKENLNFKIIRTVQKKYFKNIKIIILKTKQRFKSERHNVFTEEIDKIALSSNDAKRMQSIDSIETYSYGTNKDLVNLACQKKEIKCNIIIK